MSVPYRHSRAPVLALSAYRLSSLEFPDPLCLLAQRDRNEGRPQNQNHDADSFHRISDQSDRILFSRIRIIATFRTQVG
jgi:hypothetical protein